MEKQYHHVTEAGKTAIVRETATTEEARLLFLCLKLL